VQARCPEAFPHRGSVSRLSLPSTGSAWRAFAGFHGTMKNSDPPTPIPLDFVSFVELVPHRASAFVSPS